MDTIEVMLDDIDARDGENSRPVALPGHYPVHTFRNTLKEKQRTWRA